MDALHSWLTAQLERVSGRSGLAEAIRYALRHWDGLALFLEDGRVELDTNTIERATDGTNTVTIATSGYTHVLRLR